MAIDALFDDGVTALFHEPFGGAGSTANADSVDTFEPGTVYLSRTLDEVTVGIDTTALIEQYLAITALATTDEEDEVVAGGKLRDVGHAVGYRATDGVKGAEGGIRRDVRLDIVDDAVKLVERLGGLRIEEDVT